jgi:hypothetical protein
MHVALGPVRLVCFFLLMAAIGTVNTIGQNQPVEPSMCPAETEANSNQTSGPTYIYQDAIQTKKNGAN